MAPALLHPEPERILGKFVLREEHERLQESLSSKEELIEALNRKSNELELALKKLEQGRCAEAKANCELVKVVSRSKKAILFLQANAKTIAANAEEEHQAMEGLHRLTEAHRRRCVMERGHTLMSLCAMDMGYGVLQMCIEAPDMVKPCYVREASSRLQRALLLTQRCTQVYSMVHDQYCAEPEVVDVHAWARLPCPG